MGEAENRNTQVDTAEQEAPIGEECTQGSPDFQDNIEAAVGALGALSGNGSLGMEIPENIPPEAAQMILGIISGYLNGFSGINGFNEDGTPVEGNHIIFDQYVENETDDPMVGCIKGPVNVEEFELGEVLEMPSKADLKTMSKNDLIKLVRILISWVNVYATNAQESRHRIESLTLKVQELTRANEKLKQALGYSSDQMGRVRNVTYGQKSERRSTLEGNPSAGKTEAAPIVMEETASQEGVSAPDQATQSASSDSQNGSDTSSSEENGETKDKSAQKDTSAQTEESSAQEASGKADEADSFRKHNSKPRRQEGCSEEVTRNIPRIVVRKTVDESIFEELARQGHKVRHLPIGSYDQVVYLTLPILVHVESERIQDTVTGETYAADSAAESKILNRSKLSESLLTRLMFMRYDLGLSAPRILRDLQTDGLKLTRQSIYRWSIQYALALARPLVHRLLIKILESGKAQADETWVKVREDLARQGRCNSILWLIRASEKLDIPRMVVVVYTGSRSAESLAKLIRGYAQKLKLMSDGYSAYTALLNEFADNLELTACLQHARSKFVDVIQALKGKKEYSKMSEEQRRQLEPNKILDLFGKIFKLEDKLDDFETYEEKLNYRLTTVLPALDDLFAQIEAYAKEPKAKILGYWKTAIEYALKFKERFYAAVKDPDMPLHNSACERAFAQFGTLRNNFKQEDTVLGTEACALWFSVIQTAKENVANPQVYLMYLFEKLPAILKEHGDYHWYSQKELQKIRSLDDLKGYGDLSYLDEFMSFGDDFEQYENAFQDKRKETIIWIAEKLNEATQSSSELQPVAA